jgi:hypothetical protein
VCHECHKPVSFDTDIWLHLDGTTLCYEVLTHD